MLLDLVHHDRGCHHLVHLSAIVEQRWSVRNGSCVGFKVYNVDFVYVVERG